MVFKLSINNRVKVLFVLILTMISSSAVFAAGENLSFDKDTSGWSIYNPSGADSSVSWDSQVGKNTPGSAKIESRSDVNFVYRKVGRMEIDSTATGYAFTAWVKADGDIDSWMKLKFMKKRDSPGQVWSCDSRDYENQNPPLIYNKTIENGWRKLYIKIPVFRLDDGTHASAVEVHVVSKGRGTLWVDDISLKPYRYATLKKLTPSGYKTPLSDRFGRPAAIVLVPENVDEAKAAKKLAKKLSLPTMPEPAFKRPLPIYPLKGIDANTNIILVSSGKGGPVTQALRRALWIRENDRIPGKDGYAIRTIARPFRSAANVIAISGGGVKGLKKACDVFVSEVRKNNNRFYDKFLVMKASKEWEKNRNAWWNADHDTVFFDHARKYCDGGRGRGWTLRLLQLANRYYLTGDDEYARIYKKNVTERFSYPAASSSDDHMGLSSLIFSWDFIDESSVFSQQERLEITQKMLNAMDSHEGYGVRMIFKAAQYNHPLRLRHNHWMITANGLLGGYLYFDRLYGLERAQEWKDWAEDVASNVVAWGGPEDSAHYQVRAFTEASLHWRFQGLSSKDKPGTENFEDFARLMVGLRDNASLLASYGDSAMQGSLYAPFGVVSGDDFNRSHFHNHQTEFLLYMAQDWDFPYTQWFYDKIITERKKLAKAGYDVFGNDMPLIGKFHCGMNALEPDFLYQFGSAAVGGPSWIQPTSEKNMAQMKDELGGLMTYHREPEYYDWRAGGILWNNLSKFPSFTPTWVPPAHKTFDKIIYRDGFELKDDYFVVDGLGEDIDHGHFDLGNIPRYMTGGRIWITDQAYFDAQRRFHFLPEVFRNGYPTEKVILTYEQEPWVIKDHFSKWPAMVELLECTPDVAGETQDTVTIKFQVKDLSGTRSLWTRQIQRNADKSLEVIDTIEAMEDGDFKIVWRLPLLANALNGNGGSWTATQNGASLPIKLFTKGSESIKTAKLIEYNENSTAYKQYYWYPYVDHVEGPTTIEWQREMKMKKGQKTVFKAILGPAEIK